MTAQLRFPVSVDERVTSAHTRCKIRDQQNWKSGKDKIEISSGRPQHAESKKIIVKAMIYPDWATCVLYDVAK
jgi:hypothetical protein